MVQTKVIIITGPTATGKTKAGVRIAKEFNGEVVNCDSMQMYKLFNIGTAKTTDEETEGIAHHLIDFLEPDEEFNAGMFLKEATLIINEINKRGKVPIVVGGTGFYVEALTEGLSEIPEVSKKTREKVHRLLDEKGIDYLFFELERVDREYAARINRKDRQRITRALEVFFETGKPFSSFHGRKKKPNDFEFLKIVLNRPRKELYEAINRRVLLMFENGFVDEVKALIQKGYDLGIKPMNSPGYREIYNYLQRKDQNGTIDDLIKEIQKQHRRYAKRQLTWFKRKKGYVWIKHDDIKKMIGLISDFLKK